jgi:hypothetical protein|tara:strand:+ start:1345 stop:2064 length:720 start_codon:yes stop_codon:yes gene_type:complete
MSSLSDLLSSKTPKYTMEIPSTKKNATYRPFLVKEEKVLLLAQTSENHSEILLAVKNIIESCVDDIGDVSDIPIFDVEYIFINLRAKSVGEIVEPVIVCPKTNEKVTLEINLMDIGIKENKNHKNKIQIDENIILEMGYPSISIIQKTESDIDYTDPDSFYNLISMCIKKVHTAEETIETSLLPEHEVNDFIDNMNRDQFEKVLDFFLTSPRLEYEAEYTTSDDVQRTVVLSGLSDFFG